VPAGDAVDEVTSDRFWIETKVQVRSVLAAQSTPAVVTPNGDGINDVAMISYDLFETTGPVPVAVTIHDLTGHLVRELATQDLSIGHYEVAWDGRNDAGRLGRPGRLSIPCRDACGRSGPGQLGPVNVVY
jgi:hypothetical protein